MPGTTGGIRDMRAGGLIHHPGAECLHTLLEPGELGDFRGLAVADHDIRLMTDDGLHQLADGRARVLVVAIGVHHDVGTMLERVIHAIAERTGQAHRLGMVDHVLHTKGSCHLHGVV